MSKKSTAKTAAETKTAEKKPSEKQAMLADYREMSAAHKSWRQKFSGAFPKLHSEALDYLKEVAEQIAAFDKKLDEILAKSAES